MSTLNITPEKIRQAANECPEAAKTFLLPINKEESRDKLTELGLINFNCV